MARQKQEKPESEFLITKEDLRKHKGCENLSDEKAQRIIESIEDFCNLTYQFYLELMTKKDE